MVIIFFMKNLFLLLSFLVLNNVKSNAQEKLQQYFTSTFTYPAEASENKVYGLVNFYMMIDDEGKLKMYEIYNGMGDGCSDMILSNLRNKTNWSDVLPENHKTITFKVPVLFIHEKQFSNILKKETIKISTVQQKEKEDKSPFEYVEKMPEFPKGENELMKYIANHIKYPKKAIEKNTSGRVYIEFVIDTTGDITNVKVSRGLGDGCDEEALRVIAGMPKWKAGEQNGKKVKVSYIIPINFALEGGNVKKAYRHAQLLDTIKIYNILSFNPSYKGGESTFKDDLKDKLYKKIKTIENKVSGTIELDFTIDESAKLTNIKITKSINETYDTLLINSLQEMNNFYFESREKKAASYHLEIPFE